MKQWELKGVTADRFLPGSAVPAVASETVVEAMAEHVPAIVWTIDRDLYIKAAFGRGWQDIGFLPRDLLGFSVLDLFRGEGHGVMRWAHLRALEGEAVSVHMRWATKSFACRIAPLLIRIGEPAGAIGIGLEVTPTESLRADVAHWEREALIDADTGPLTDAQRGEEVLHR